MMKMAVVCPPESILADLLQGKIDEPELGELAEHLQHCSTCQDRARSIPTLDNFAALLGTDPQSAIAIASGIPRPLIEKVKSIAHDTLASHASTNGSAQEDENDGDWTFLAPPQGTDEIGRLGGYRVLQVIGRGGMGVVFRAEDPSLKRIVALKAMLPKLAASSSAKKRFLREAQTAASIKHDHIVTIFQVGVDRDAPYLAMEFLHGESLDARLKREGKLLIAEVLRIGREVAEGLAAAHHENLIHRDIKPANVWLESKKGEPGVSATGGRVKILDFGLARIDDDQGDLTSSGVIVGTPAFMAPEQVQNENVDHRCDHFSLGCMLYVMATGAMPFTGKNGMSRLLAAALTEPTPPAELNPAIPLELSRLILRLLAKDPAKRPHDAHAVAAALQALKDQVLQQDQTAASSVMQPPVPMPARGKGQGGFLVACAIAVMAVAAMLIAAGIIFYLPTSDGTIRVEILDDQTEVVLNKTGIVIKKAGEKHNLVLTPGEYAFHVKRGDLDFHTDKLILKKGTTIQLKVEYMPGKLLVARVDGKTVGEKAAPPVAEPVVSSLTPRPEPVGKQVTGIVSQAATRWPLAPSRPEDIQRLLDAKTQFTLRTGTSRDIKVTRPEELPKAPATVVSVTLTGNPIPIDSALIDVVARLTDLEHLVFSSGSKNVTGPDDIKKLATLVQLRKLSFWGVHAQGASGILKSMPHLESILLPYAVGDEWAAALVHLPSVVEVDCYRIGISDAGLAHLEKMPQLKFVRLQDNHQLSQAAVEKFAAAVPGCRIMWGTYKTGVKTIEPRTNAKTSASRQASPP